MAGCSSQRIKFYLHDLSFALRAIACTLLLTAAVTACAKSDIALVKENQCHVAFASNAMTSNATKSGVCGDSEQKKAALVNVELGLNYLAQEDVARAKLKLMHALKLAPTASEPHSALAHFFETTGDAKEAEQEHKKAIRLGSTKGALYNNYGAFLYRQNRFKEAELAFKTALQDKSYAYTAAVNENAGRCALRLANNKQAEKYFATALRQDPKRAKAILLMKQETNRKINHPEDGSKT